MPTKVMRRRNEAGRHDDAARMHRDVIECDPAIAKHRREEVLQRVRPYRLSEAAALLGVSYHHLWRQCVKNELPHTKSGKIYLIPAHVVHALLEGLPVPPMETSAKAPSERSAR